MKKPAKLVKLVLRREQVRTLEAKDLQPVAGGMDSDPVNCPLLRALLTKPGS